MVAGACSIPAEVDASAGASRINSKSVRTRSSSVGAVKTRSIRSAIRMGAIGRSRVTSRSHFQSGSERQLIAKTSRSRL
jgi:hypothetical protein